MPGSIAPEEGEGYAPARHGPLLIRLDEYEREGKGISYGGGTEGTLRVWHDSGYMASRTWHMASKRLQQPASKVPCEYGQRPYIPGLGGFAFAFAAGAGGGPGFVGSGGAAEVAGSGSGAGSLSFFSEPPLVDCGGGEGGAAAAGGCFGSAGATVLAAAAGLGIGLAGGAE